MTLENAYRIAGNFRRVKFSDISDIQIISENILSEFIMALLKYFKVSKTERQYLFNGPLAKEMPSSAIAAANSSIAKVMEIHQQKQDTTGKLRGEYRVNSGNEKAEIAKRAAVYGINRLLSL